MTTETIVSVQIGSEVSASVPQTIYNTIATSTPDVSWWQGIINWVTNLF